MALTSKERREYFKLIRLITIDVGVALLPWYKANMSSIDLAHQGTTSWTTYIDQSGGQDGLRGKTIFSSNQDTVTVSIFAGEFLERKIDANAILEVMAHEFVHVAQLMSSNRGDVIKKNEAVAEYYDKPMEKEAYRMQSRGLQAYKKSGRLSDTLDRFWELNTVAWDAAPLESRSVRSVNPEDRVMPSDEDGPSDAPKDTPPLR